jgi:hypothetical protein
MLNALTMDNFKVKQKIDIQMQHLWSSAKWSLEYGYDSLQSESSISIPSLNKCSLHAHINDILSDYDTMKLDILFLQETYMTLSMKDEQFVNLNCISNCNKHRLIILVKKHLTIFEHMHFEEQTVEVRVEKVIVHGSQIAIVNIYATPHAYLNRVMSTITKALCDLNSKEIIIILGYFNIDMLQRNKKFGKLHVQL